MTSCISYLESIDSTNEEAKRRLKSQTTTPFAIVADTQTHGKGQRENRWCSDSKEGLYYSLALAPERCDIANIQEHYNDIGNIIIQFIKAKSGLEATLKKPNDILIKGKKCVGILVETVIGSESKHPKYVIIGVGFNINQTSFPDEIKSRAISLRQLTNQSYNKKDFIEHLTKELPHVFKRR